MPGRNGGLQAKEKKIVERNAAKGQNSLFNFLGPQTGNESLATKQLLTISWLKARPTTHMEELTLPSNKKAKMQT